MEITVGMFLLLLLLAFVSEYIDSSMGMGYGTILTPSLLILGFEPLVVVPAVLITQAFGGLTASMFHYQFENASFKRDSTELKSVVLICGFGIVATVLAATLSLGIPKFLLKTYIGILVLAMGVIILKGISFKFTWKKMIGIGILSAFNKGLSGGGFGPVVTGGQVISGQSYKNAVGVTTLAEAPICICGFFSYLIAQTVKEMPHPILDISFNNFISHMFSPKLFHWQIILALFLGAILVAPFGAFTTRALKKEYAKYITGGIMTVLGIITLLKTWL